MAISVNSTVGLTISGLPQTLNLSGSSIYAPTGHASAMLTMDVGSVAWTAIPISPAATLAKLLIIVGTPSVSGTKIYLALDNAGTNPFCGNGTTVGLPVGDVGLFPFPPATIYAKSNATGTDKVPILYCFSEQ